MKLSEAILLGIGAVTDDRSVFLTNTMVSGPCGCAIGTALHAVGETDRDGFVMHGVEACERVWPWTAGHSQRVVGSLAMEISNRHSNGESRERIAAWVATIEPQEEAAPATATAHVEKAVQGVSTKNCIPNCLPWSARHLNRRWGGEVV